MKQVLFFLCLLLITACAGAKRTVSTATSSVEADTQTSRQNTDSSSCRQIYTQTMEMQTDSTTETLIFELTDTGNVKIDADGTIKATGVKSFTKNKKSSQRAGKVAKTESLAQTDHHVSTENDSSTYSSQYFKADSTSREPTAEATGSVLRSLAELLTRIMAVVLMAALLALCWYAYKNAHNKS